MPVSSGENKIIPCALCGSLDFKQTLACEGFSFVRCKKCYLVQRNPRYSQEEIIERYSKVYGQDYLSYEIENEDAFLDLQKLALKDAGFLHLQDKLLVKNDPPAILDIGCATGALLAVLREKGWEAKGVEISPCAFYARENRALDVKSLPLEECNFAPESFDVILASHLIEHLNDPRSFLAEVYRILKKSGYVFITTPNISGFQARLYAGAWRSAIFDHLYLFSKGTLSKMLKGSGFKIESCRTWGGLAKGSVPFWLKKIADRLAKIFGFGDVMIYRVKK